jgi:hypothetical protein
MAHRVYVIELQPPAGRRRDPRIPWVYVGSSARDPQLRFAQHLRGYKAARLVRRFGARLRPDLFEDLAPCRGSAAARQAELARARELAACGFVAHSDGVSHGVGRGAWEPWDAVRIAPIRHHVDAAAAALFASAFQPLDPALCARLLHGERGFWVDALIDPLDPPPAYGLFAHVEIEVLRDRAKDVMTGAVSVRADHGIAL